MTVSPTGSLVLELLEASAARLANVRGQEEGRGHPWGGGPGGDQLLVEAPPQPRDWPGSGSRSALSRVRGE